MYVLLQNVIALEQKIYNYYMSFQRSRFQVASDSTPGLGPL